MYGGIHYLEKQLKQKKNKVNYSDSAAFQTWLQEFINEGTTKQHIREDQMQNQTVLSQIRYIFKEQPQFYTQCPISD